MFQAVSVNGIHYYIDLQVGIWQIGARAVGGIFPNSHQEQFATRCGADALVNSYPSNTSESREELTCTKQTLNFSRRRTGGPRKREMNRRSSRGTEPSIPIKSIISS